MPVSPGAGEATARSLVLMAPAKINLALHVVGQRAEGHHLLESLVTFADTGDLVSSSLSDSDRFTVSGPFAGDVPAHADVRQANLVLRARDALRARLTGLGLSCGPVALHLTKNLPVASGIGGGSADAAATLLGLLRLWTPAGDTRADIDLAEIGLSLGADLPMCLAGRPLIARGIGEAITPVTGLPTFPALLVNPGAPVSTPAVFRALHHKDNPPLILPDRLVSPEDWIAAISATRNDLETPARVLAPVIGAVRDALAESGAAVSRMSGSGATCFALFLDSEARDRAAAALRAAHPDWYLLPCGTLGS